MSVVQYINGLPTLDRLASELFSAPHGLWKSAKWKQTERLIRRSRFWCSGSNENQMTSMVIHHRRATLRAPIRQSWYIEMAVKRLGIQASAGAHPSVLNMESSRSLVSLLLDHSRIVSDKNRPTTYWFLPVIWILRSVPCGGRKICCTVLRKSVLNSLEQSTEILSNLS